MKTHKFIGYGIVYGDKTTGFFPYETQFPESPWRFENNAIIDIIDHLKKENHYRFVGIFSWKFRSKVGMTADNVKNLCERLYYSNYDLINFSPDLGTNIGGCGNFMDWSDKGHIGIKSMVERCCKHVGMLYQNDPNVVVYANMFAARHWLYSDYVETVIKPCLKLLEGEMWEEVNREAGYTAGLEKEELKRLTGLDFYNYVPFILERMMMQYIANKGVQTINA